MILLADDNPHAQQMGSEILGQEGHTVVTVPDGDAALEYLTQNRPAVVLADLAMPGLSGYEICRFIKGQRELESIKVVLLRGPLEPLDQAKADEARPDAMLQKPLDADALVRTVDQLLEEAGENEKHRMPIRAAHDSSSHGKADLTPPTLPGHRDGQAATASTKRPNPFAALVERALETDRDEAEQRAQVQAAVSEVLESLTPALIDRITERVLKALRKD